MRVLGFSKKWSKLYQPDFTTFRYARKDRDWEIEEKVQIVYHPRSKDREVLGFAEIVKKECGKITDYGFVTDAVAKEDGFADRQSMLVWFQETYTQEQICSKPMNKLTLRRI